MIISYNIPRILISSHKGGAGKTVFTVGLVSTLRSMGLSLSAFKKGPDYIDAGWLSKVLNVPCRNLDLFLFNEKDNLYSFYVGSKDSEIAIIEGNRGLFDGVDIFGSCSTARLASLLKVPIILVLDCTKVTRSMAAIVKGFLEFEKDISIKGVILNQIARNRHENVIRNAIEYYTDIKVLGSLPKLKNLPHERHLGLITSFEYGESSFIETLQNTITENVNIKEILEISKDVPPLEIEKSQIYNASYYDGIKIGIFKDQAFQFYYPENIEYLQLLGAEITYINSLEEKRLPSDLSALYLGGGFPEVKAQELAENYTLKKDVKDFVEAGYPLYAECGGLMYLGEEIVWQGKKFPMAGVLPIRFNIDKRPRGHGYVKAKVVAENPYFNLGDTILGHEFHYSYPESLELKKGMRFIFQLEKGTGLDGKHDGLVYKNLLAGYTHIHIFSVKYWAENFLSLAANLKKTNRGGGVRCLRLR